jgi:ABC-type sugar transport system ATPase subunit
MLEVRDLSITLGEFSLHNVALRVQQGQYVCLAGPTGAGKTILLECIAGLHRPPQGAVLLDGHDLTDLPPEVRGIGYVPQDYALFPHMDVFGNIAYGLVERGIPKAQVCQRVRSAADLLQIPHLLNRRVTTLSGGERQRVALGRTLVLDCRVLLLDEPLSALDGVTRRELSMYLADLHQRLGLTVIHVTHDFDEAFSLATHIGICDSGRLLQTGTVEEVFSCPNCRTVASFLGINNIFAVGDAGPTACPTISRLASGVGDLSPNRCVCVHPDRIRLTCTDKPAGDFVLEGTVRRVRWFGPIHEVTLDVGAPLVATLSRQEQQVLNLQTGDTVSACIDRSAVHVLDDW